jgi:hypothetical protein
MRRKKTDIPKQIEVGAHKIPVIFKPDMLTHATAYGLFDKDKMAIYLDEFLEENSSLAWETFWHEVIEVLNYVTEADMEHRDIQTIGLLLHQVFDSAFADKIIDSR